VTNEEVIQKLKAARGQRKEISRATGVPYGTLAKWVNGDTKDPRTSQFEEVRRYLIQHQRRMA
jgi:predicted transcriptional regulator